MPLDKHEARRHSSIQCGILQLEAHRAEPTSSDMAAPVLLNGPEA